LHFLSGFVLSFWLVCPVTGITVDQSSPYSFGLDLGMCVRAVKHNIICTCRPLIQPRR